MESLSVGECRQIPPPDECMSFDDTPHGINAAKTVGIGLNIVIPDQIFNQGSVKGKLRIW